MQSALKTCNIQKCAKTPHFKIKAHFYGDGCSFIPAPPSVVVGVEIPPHTPLRLFDSVYCPAQIFRPGDAHTLANISETISEEKW